MERLSGDQKGCAALSVPASLTAVSPRTGRTYSDVPPDWSGLATNAIVWPSGDTAKSGSLKPEMVCRN